MIRCRQTDVSDGPTDGVDAIVDKTTLARTIDAMVSLTEHLAINDSNHLFQALDDLPIDDPTNTTIMNLLIVLIPE